MTRHAVAFLLVEVDWTNGDRIPSPIVAALGRERAEAELLAVGTERLLERGCDPATIRHEVTEWIEVCMIVEGSTPALPIP